MPHAAGSRGRAENSEVDEPENAAALALGFFAGLRTDELRRLDWRNVDIEQALLPCFRSGKETPNPTRYDSA